MLKTNNDYKFLLDKKEGRKEEARLMNKARLRDLQREAAIVEKESRFNVGKKILSLIRDAKFSNSVEQEIFFATFKYWQLALKDLKEELAYIAGDPYFLSLKVTEM